MADKEKKEGEGPFIFTPEVMHDALGGALTDAKRVAGQGFSTLVSALFIEELSVQDAFGLQPEQVEGVYGQAYRLFNNGQYEDAKNIFTVLAGMDLQEPKYPLGVAACLHMQKKYCHAAPMYYISAMLDPKNPIPYFHKSECHVEIKDWKQAVKSLKETIKRCGNKAEYAVIKDRAKMTLKVAQQGVKDRKKRADEKEKRKAKIRAKKAAEKKEK